VFSLFILSLAVAELMMAKLRKGDLSTEGQLTVDEMLKRYGKLEAEKAIYERDYKE
jgi:hypothetical protein